MAPPGPGAKARWSIAAGVAAVAMGGMLLFFRVPTPPTATAGASARARPPIHVEAARGDELALQDLAPLFLPTRYNAAPSALKQPEPGQSYFDTDAVKLHFDDANPGVHLPPPFHAPPTPADALADSPGPLAAGIGRTNASPAPAPPHAAQIEVFAEANGEAVLTQTLGVSARPTVGGREIQGWSPVEFVASVDAMGLVGPLLVTSGSGVEDVDNFFRNYLAKTFRLGDRLTPGFYRIVVGP